MPRFAFGSRHRRENDTPSVDPRLGLDSVSFSTFGWPQIEDRDGFRAWSGPGGEIVSEYFFPIPPDLPSLEETELEPRFGVCDRSASTEEGDPPLLIEFGVRHAVPIPVVRAVIRIPVGRGFAFQGSLILPLASCSWVIKTSAPDGPVTGVREALALDHWLREQDPPASLDALDDFDPYDVRWDGRFDDPLSGVRTRLGEIESTIAFGPELEGQPPF